MRSGIVVGSPQVAAAARTAVLRAIAAAKAAAGVASPSKVFYEIGLWIARGLEGGITDGSENVQKALERMVERFREFFDALKGRFADFKRSISSGINSFKDLFGAIGGLFGQTDEAGNPIAVTGAAIAQTIQEQVAQAQALAATLKQLAKAGLSQQMLAQLAGQGAQGIAIGQALLADPALIAQMNAAQEAITQAAQSTADSLGEKFFGEALRRAKERLDELSEALRMLNQAIRLRENGPAGGMTVVLQNPTFIGVPSDAVVDALHEGLLRKQRRNGSLAFT